VAVIEVEFVTKGIGVRERDKKERDDEAGAGKTCRAIVYLANYRLPSGFSPVQSRKV